MELPPNTLQLAVSSVAVSRKIGTLRPITNRPSAHIHNTFRKRGVTLPRCALPYFATTTNVLGTTPQALIMNSKPSNHLLIRSPHVHPMPAVHPPLINNE
ncbi:hypothetical protein ZHAS_00010682 [Anopheles sinensis]|uniref:Uncharacterized protein n=1 Tax=Anopheles sinensis TaxID=74873 RepID=A0A084VYG6_ANOSI|nr:hypothetical protein ZHAS_00010682 [Anopheles sinensis]